MKTDSRSTSDFIMPRSCSRCASLIHTDYMEDTIELPIDHGTWYLQWIVSNGWQNATFTSRTYKVN